ncbi:hypothetical protein [Phocaeicola plebeius]|uniref:hypothetical protein n=1 Tax=Phocaeicola plebeius TaxID=310297 RepID=UPI0040290305
MRTGRRIKVYPNLGLVTKIQRQLLASEQERNKLKKLYIDEATEHYKAERRLKIEIQRTAFYCDCVEVLNLILIDVKSLSKEEIEAKLNEYREFKQKAYQTFVERKDELNKIELSVYGKYKVLYADEKEALQKDLAQTRTLLEKEKAFSCYLYDCKDILITSLYDVNNECPQINNIIEKFMQFDKLANKRFEEKIKTLSNEQ